MIKRFLILLIILGLVFFGYWLINRQGAIDLKEKIIYIFDKKINAVPIIGTGSDNEYPEIATGAYNSGITTIANTGLDVIYTGSLATGGSLLHSTGVDEDFFDTTGILTGKIEVLTAAIVKENKPIPLLPKTTTTKTSSSKTGTKQYKNILNALFQ